MSSKYLPRKGMTQLAQLWYRVDLDRGENLYGGVDAVDNYEFDMDGLNYCKERLTLAKGREDIDAVIDANRICSQASKEGSAGGRINVYKQAIEKCPTLCPRAYVLLFTEELSKAVKKHGGELSTKGIIDAQVVAKTGWRAVKAGRAFVKLIQAHKFCKGNLYTFLPTRWFIRALYMLGSFLFYIGGLREADALLKECIANDIHDKLGARHKQLLVALAVGPPGVCVKTIGRLLKSQYGEDQLRDDVFALWNYTRALHAFVKNGGGCAKANKLLALAIKKNPYTPPLLLHWENPRFNPFLMQVGSPVEASDYVADNLRKWQEVSGSLAWLESQYCRHSKAIVPALPPAMRKQLSEATAVLDLDDAPVELVEKAVATFQYLADAGAVSQRKLRAVLFQRMGRCCAKISDHQAAVGHFSSALSAVPPPPKKNLSRRSIMTLPFPEKAWGTSRVL